MIIDTIQQNNKNQSGGQEKGKEKNISYKNIDSIIEYNKQNKRWIQI